MPPVGYFGINNDGINLAINLVVLFVVVIYASLIYWTYADARRRIADPWLVTCAIFASLFPFVGTVIYMVVRPPEYLDDVRERELEMQASEARLASLQLLCRHCDYEVQADFLVCPNCYHRLKAPCQHCGKPLEQTWGLCPYCETPVPEALEPPRRTRRRRTGPGEPVGGEAPPTSH
ncbi:MAG TPA: zinc ribbon domain-containing protein [Solirubrobacteraceae bacterium]|jgi:RNA polymerase subunit RPABC4/transcription elongation factor Spt4|nr:zinc ribbon domain-containing protein [Solirubrobacteraceae bacterium]